MMYLSYDTQLCSEMKELCCTVLLLYY